MLLAYYPNYNQNTKWQIEYTISHIFFLKIQVKIADTADLQEHPRLEFFMCDAQTPLHISKLGH